MGGCVKKRKEEGKNGLLGRYKVSTARYYLRSANNWLYLF
jgi:hypothetical protein